MQSGNESKENTKKSEQYAAEVKSVLEKIKAAKTVDHENLASQLFAIWGQIDSKEVPRLDSSDGRRLRAGLRPSGMARPYALYCETCPSDMVDLIRASWSDESSNRPSVDKIIDTLNTFLAQIAATEKAAKQSTLNQAIKDDKLSEVDWFLSHGAKPDAVTLNCAIMLNNKNLVEKILKYNPAINEDTLNCALLNPQFFDEVIKLPNIQFNADTLHCSAISGDKFKIKLTELGCVDKSNKSQLEVLAELTKAYGVPFFLFKTNMQLYTQLEKHRLSDSVLKEVFQNRFAEVYKVDSEQHELDEKIFSSVADDINKNYRHLLKGSQEEKQKIVLVSNFKLSDQGRFQQFWQEQVPLLGQQFSAIANEMEFPATGLAFKLYSLVADQHRAIAMELGQRHPSGMVYGLFRNSGSFRDIVLEKDEWDIYYEPMRKYLRQYPNEELTFFEKMTNYEGSVVNVPISKIQKIVAGHQTSAMLSDKYIADNRKQSGILLDAPHREYQDCIFKRLDGLVKEALDLKVTKDNTDKFLFLLGSIMWYLGNYVPLLAGSANATENFINSLLSAKQFSLEKYVMHEGVPWFFLCKITPREDFVKVFASFFEKTPELMSEMKVEEDKKFKLKLFDKPTVQSSQANTVVDANTQSANPPSKNPSG